MKMQIQDFDLTNKKVIIRCDLNVVIKDGVIVDDTRIRASLKTISYVLDNGGAAIILSHLGKIKEKSDLVINDLYPVSVRLSELLGRKVLFSSETRGGKLEKMISLIKPGDVILIQNTRYEDLDGNKESSCDDELASYWASLGDIFINDAYGTCHRKHASNVGIAKHLPNGLGFLVSNEVSKLDNIINEDTHPFVVIMGGAKVSDKIRVISNLIIKCDKLIIGGGMAYTFLKSLGYNVGCSLVDQESISFCKQMLDKYKDKIILPIDSVLSLDINSDKCFIKDIEDISSDEIGLDIGPRTIELFINNLKDAKRVVINGPMGLYENKLYSNGTKCIYDFIISNNIKTLVGGGDSIASVNKLSDASKFYHISTGGGATLEYLEGKELPGISVIDER